jgi:hypothetical protein
MTVLKPARFEVLGRTGTILEGARRRPTRKSTAHSLDLLASEVD